MLGMSLLFSTLLFTTLARAGLYGTRPIANTVLSSGRLSSVNWINDNTAPSLKEMGPMRIDLYRSGDIFVATLADNVEPTSRSHKVWISPTWGPNGSDYHMRFTCEDPPLTIYTADFTVTAMDDTPRYQGSENAVADSEASIGTSYATPSATTATYSLPTMYSQLYTSSSSAVSSTPSMTRVSSTSVNTASAASTGTGNPYMNKAKTGAGGGSWMRTSVDLERVKFRLVFVLWPVLIGLTLAL